METLQTDRDFLFEKTEIANENEIQIPKGDPLRDSIDRQRQSMKSDSPIKYQNSDSFMLRSVTKDQGESNPSSMTIQISSEKKNPKRFSTSRSKYLSGNKKSLGSTQKVDTTQVVQLKLVNTFKEVKQNK